MINIKNIDINEVKNETVGLLKSTKRKGIEDLIIFLEEHNYFTIPANRIGYKWNELEKPHPLNRKGGLAIQNWLVYNEFNRKNEMLSELAQDSVIICSFLHSLWKLDVCQTNEYEGFIPLKKKHEDLYFKEQRIDYEVSCRVKLEDVEKNIVTYYKGLFGVFELDAKKGHFGASKFDIQKKYSLESFAEISKKHPEVQTFSAIVREIFEYTKGETDTGHNLAVNERDSKIEKYEYFWL
jgi:hypothetical protein